MITEKQKQIVKDFHENYKKLLLLCREYRKNEQNPECYWAEIPGAKELVDRCGECTKVYTIEMQEYSRGFENDGN